MTNNNMLHIHTYQFLRQYQQDINETNCMTIHKYLTPKSTIATSSTVPNDREPFVSSSNDFEWQMLKAAGIGSRVNNENKYLQQ